MERKTYKVLVADNLAADGIKILEEHPDIEVVVNTKHTKEELMDLIGDFDAVIVRSATKIDADVINAARKLKVVARAGTGYNNIDVEECTRRGIVVLITPLGNTNAVIELTMGLMIAASRFITAADRSMKEGRWDKKKFKGIELKGKTVGIIGLGRIGTGVAERCKAFGMEVIAYDKFVPRRRAEELGVKLIDNLDEFLSMADYITIHIPLTPDTKNLLNEERFKHIKKGAILINLARGGIVDEKVLYEYLKEGKLRAACVDVYSQEPADPEKFPFIKLPNCIATPHIGASTVEAQRNVAVLAAEHVICALISKIYIDAVNLPYKISEQMVDIYRPYIRLASIMGKFMSQYNTGRYVEITIRYKGDVFSDITPIKNAMLSALFENRLTEYKNLLLIKIDDVLKEHGINLIIEEYKKSVNFEQYLKLYVKNEKGKVSKIAGTVFSERPKIVEIDGQYFDIEPSDYMILFRNIDKPGVIGKIGTFLGNRGINIAGLQLGRQEKGTMALSVISVDDPPKPEDLEELKKIPDIIEPKLIVI